MLEEGSGPPGVKGGVSEQGFSIAEDECLFSLLPSLFLFELWDFHPSSVLVSLEASLFPSVPVWVVSNSRCTSHLCVCICIFVCLLPSSLSLARSQEVCPCTFLLWKDAVSFR